MVINPVYFNTHFKRLSAAEWMARPDHFAIITAWPTTGQTWPPLQIQAADRALEAELRQRSTWVARITGYDPATDWAEPGWAAAIGFEQACQIGDRFKQDALYYVVHELLYVSHCDERRSLVKVGVFDERLHDA
jgi:uncharacterized protein DUF3293